MSLHRGKGGANLTFGAFGVVGVCASALGHEFLGLSEREKERSEERERAVPLYKTPARRIKCYIHVFHYFGENYTTL